MIRLLLRSRRLRWLLTGWVVRYLARRSVGRSIDGAARSLEERLPPPVSRALDAVPVDVVRAGGSVVVAGRVARRAAVTGAKAGRTATRRVQRPIRMVRRIRARGGGLGAELEDEIEQARRRLTSRYLLATRGRAAADDALLDLRFPDRAAPGDDDGGPVDTPLPELPQPVAPGRRRADRRRRPPVDRVQRTYHRPIRSWDR